MVLFVGKMDRSTLDHWLTSSSKDSQTDACIYPASTLNQGSSSSEMEETEVHIPKT